MRENQIVDRTDFGNSVILRSEVELSSSIYVTEGHTEYL